MTASGLKQRRTVSLEAVRRRPRELPALAALIGDPIEQLADKAMYRDTAPRILALVGEEGASSRALLSALERTVELFDAQDTPGWANARLELVRANDRAKFLATAAELITARWFHEREMTVADSSREPRTVAARTYA